MARNRMTWGRTASTAPATPGYGKEDQDHPAHQNDPDYEDYKKGDPDAWAETPKAPPYPQGNPPSTPGYDSEDKDHPAHRDLPRVKKEAELRVAIERKAKKCIKVARALLGYRATEAAIEDQALDMMDWSDTALDSTLNRMGGEEEPEEDMEEEEESGKEACGVQAEEDEKELEAMMAEMDVTDPEGVPAKSVKGRMDDILAKLASLTQEIRSLKADQNDPKGKTLAPKPKTEEQVRNEAVDTEDDEEKSPTVKAARALFASMDHDRDGFLTLEDWRGGKALFAAIDTDHDGIIAEEEMLAAAEEPEAEPEDEEGEDKMAALDAEEMAILAAMELRMGSEEEDEDEGADDSDGKQAAEEGDEEEEEEGDEEEEEEGDEEEDEDAKESAKKAQCLQDDSGMFEMQDDPMGLGNEGDAILNDDDAILTEIFGGKTAEEKEEEEEEEEAPEAPEAPEEEVEEKEPKVGKKARTSQRPQPRKPSAGVRQVGQMTRTASGNAELADLTRLWQSAPDVSGVFGTNKE